MSGKERYLLVKVVLSDSQIKKIRQGYKTELPVALSFSPQDVVSIMDENDDDNANFTLALTNRQNKMVAQAYHVGSGLKLSFSAAQLKRMSQIDGLQYGRTTETLTEHRKKAKAAIKKKDNSSSSDDAMKGTGKNKKK